MAFGIGNILGGIVGIEGGARADRQAGASETEAKELQRRALEQLMAIQLPDTELMERDYIIPELMGEYTPEMEQLFSLGSSAMEDINIDPRLAESQFAALEQLAGLSQGGLSDADIGALEQVRRATAGQDQAKQNQILQEMQQRGQGGSGAELAARLKSSQSAADRASQEGLQIAQMAQERALQSLMNNANLASGMRSQEFGEKSNVARAVDAINQFNTQNQQNVNQRNVGSQNQAQMANLNARQSIENQRANIRNQQQDINKNLQQQHFQNQLSKYAPVTNQTNTYAGTVLGTGAAAAQRTRDAAEGIGNMFAGIGGMAGV